MPMLSLAEELMLVALAEPEPGLPLRAPLRTLRRATGQEERAQLRTRLEVVVSQGAGADARDACLCRLVEAAELEASLWGPDEDGYRERVGRMPACRAAEAVERVVDRAGLTERPSRALRVERNLQGLGAAGGIAFFGSSLVWDSIDQAPPWLVYPGAAAMMVGSVGAFAMSFIRRKA